MLVNFRGFDITLIKVHGRFKPIIKDLRGCETIKTNSTFATSKEAVIHAQELIGEHYKQFEQLIKKRGKKR